MVVVVIAIAAVMSYALLANGSLQAQVGLNAATAASAEPLAESGLNLALYYLQYRWRAPVRQNGYWPGQAGLTLGSVGTTIPGTLNVTVTQNASNSSLYDLRSTASITNGSTTISHIATGQVSLAWSFGLEDQQAVITSGDLTAISGMNVTGDLYTNGTLTVNSGATVQGTVVAAGVNPPQSVGSWVHMVSGDQMLVPNVATMKDYKTYSFNGHTYQAALINSGTLNNITLNPDPVTNPGGVFYTDADTTLGDNVKINGTLIVGKVDRSVNPPVVQSGRLTISGANNLIVPQSGLPALIVYKDIYSNRKNCGLEVDGLTWLSDGIAGNGNTSGTHLSFKGALILSQSTARVDSSYSPGTLDVQYDSSHLNISDFSTTAMLVCKSIKVSAWKP